MLQIAPFLASIECLLKVLGLIGPLVEFVKAVPDPIKLASTVPKFVKAAETVMPCVAVVTGLGILPFIKDLLCLIIKALNCFLQQMKTLLGRHGRAYDSTSDGAAAATPIFCTPFSANRKTRRS